MSSFISEPGAQANIDLIKRVFIRSGSILEFASADAIFSMLPVTLEIEGTLNARLLAQAGPELDEFILEHIITPKPARAYITPGFNLNVPNVIFGIMPIWRSDLDRLDKHLIDVVRSAMFAARQAGFSRIAFPALGGGHYGYPPKRAARILLRGINDMMTPEIEAIYIICKEKPLMHVFLERLEMLTSTAKNVDRF